MAPTPGFTIHATKQLLDRVKQPVTPAVESAPALGNWYATALFWKPQVALLVNEATLLPVFVPLAPAGQLAERFPDELRSVLDAHGLDPRFVDEEISAMGEGHFAKTASRSVVGVMNEFAFLGRVHRDQHGAEVDLIALSLLLAQTTTSPLYKRHVAPTESCTRSWPGRWADRSRLDGDEGAHGGGGTRPGARRRGRSLVNRSASTTSHS